MEFDRQPHDYRIEDFTLTAIEFHKFEKLENFIYSFISNALIQNIHFSNDFSFLNFDLK